MGEFLVSKAGLGYLIIYGTQVFNLSLVYSSIILILIISYLIYIPIILIENKIKKLSS
jgi:NitT/TauT family transport system permease protein